MLRTRASGQTDPAINKDAISYESTLKINHHDLSRQEGRLRKG